MNCGVSEWDTTDSIQPDYCCYSHKVFIVRNDHDYHNHFNIVDYRKLYKIFPKRTLFLVHLICFMGIVCHTFDPIFTRNDSYRFSKGWKFKFGISTNPLKLCVFWGFADESLEVTGSNNLRKNTMCLRIGWRNLWKL